MKGKCYQVCDNWKQHQLLRVSGFFQRWAVTACISVPGARLRAAMARDISLEITPPTEGRVEYFAFHAAIYLLICFTQFDFL